MDVRQSGGMGGGTDSENNNCDGESCNQVLCETKRRQLLGMVASGGTLALAGCTGLLASPDPEPVRGREQNYVLEFLRQDERVGIRGSETVLRGAEEHGLELPYQCRAGFCGVCLAKAEDENANDVVHMAVNDFDLLTDEAVQDGYFLPCTSQPRDEFTIRTHVDWDELDPYQDEEKPIDDGAVAEDVGVYPIEYVNEEVTIYVPEDRDLLSTGKNAALELPYLCREGWCGQCLAQIDGDATELVEMTTNDYEPLDEEAQKEGYTLTCTGHPRGRFILESGKFHEEDWPEG